MLAHPGSLGSYANPGSYPIILGGTGPADIHFDHVAADFSLPYAAVARITIDTMTMNNGMMSNTIELLSNGKGRGSGPIVYVTGQNLFYDSIVRASLPPKGPFQLLEMAGPSGLQTEFGPGDVGYRGGRWWVDVDGNGVQNDGDAFFMCPLLPPGRETP